MVKGTQSKIEKFLDETVRISNKRGNRVLKFSADVDSKGKLGRYSLTYININICNEDNGRVLGYDNNHGYHHRHYMGKAKKINFISFDDIKKRFEAEWRELHEKYQKNKKS